MELAKPATTAAATHQPPDHHYHTTTIQARPPTANPTTLLQKSIMTAPLLMILFSTMATSSAFSLVHPFAPTRVSASNNNKKGLHMSSAVKVPITITGDNIDLTPALTEYVNLKVDRTLGKLSSVSAVSHCDVYLTVNKNPKVCK